MDFVLKYVKKMKIDLQKLRKTPGNASKSNNSLLDVKYYHFGLISKILEKHDTWDLQNDSRTLEDMLAENNAEHEEEQTFAMPSQEQNAFPESFGMKEEDDPANISDSIAFPSISVPTSVVTRHTKAEKKKTKGKEQDKKKKDKKDKEKKKKDAERGTYGLDSKLDLLSTKIGNLD